MSQQAKAYPNPTRGTLTLSWNPNQEIDQDHFIFNLQGQNLSGNVSLSEKGRGLIRKILPCRLLVLAEVRRELHFFSFSRIVTPHLALELEPVVIDNSPSLPHVMEPPVWEPCKE